MSKIIRHDAAEATTTHRLEANDGDTTVITNTNTGCVSILQYGSSVVLSYNEAVELMSLLLMHVVAAAPHHGDKR